ncbi:MAG: hypothetical protein LAO31_13980 [Acidobacteriia bacterium]|nr:hypothetical protein [Terriglobia bacterium]
MATQSNIGMALSFLLFTGFPAWAAPSQERNQSEIVRPQIRVDDKANIKPEILENAKKVTGAIFQRAGVELQWLDCSKSKVENPNSCSPPLASGEIALHLVRYARELRLTSKTSQFGYAARIVAEGGSGGISISSMTLSSKFPDKWRESSTWTSAGHRASFWAISWRMRSGICCCPMTITPLQAS